MATRDPSDPLGSEFVEVGQCGAGDAARGRHLYAGGSHARAPRVADHVSEADRLTLRSWARRPKTAQALPLRARVVLAATTGEETNGEIAARLQTTRQTVAKWRGRYARRGLAGLTDEPRPGAPRTITDDRVDQVLATTLEQAPPVGTHWSTRQLAARLGLSQTAVSRRRR